MGVSLNHPIPQTMDDWMRLIERRLITQERREPQVQVMQRLGPGLARFAHQVFDWNTENTWFTGHYWSDVGSLNSPDPARQRLGLTRVAADEGGVQQRITHDGSFTRQRSFTYNPDDDTQHPTFGEWTDVPGGGGGSGGPPTGPAGGDLTGFYPNPQIAAGAVGNAELAPNAVTTDKIVDGTIQGADIANGAIGTAQIADGAVTSAEILDGSIMPWDLGFDITPGGGADCYCFEQQITVGSTHIVHVHNQNTNCLDLEFWDNTGVQRFGDVTKPDLNTIAVDFANPLTGKLLVYGCVGSGGGSGGGGPTQIISSPDLLAGNWTPITHTLGVPVRDVTFTMSSGGEARGLAWRVVGSSATQVEVRSDVSRSAGFYYCYLEG